VCPRLAPLPRHIPPQHPHKDLHSSLATIVQGDYWLDNVLNREKPPT
jgi:hypothetical protein